MDPAPKKEKLPPTLEDLERRLDALEERRDDDAGLSAAEIVQLRRDWFKLKKEEADKKKEEPPTEDSFLDWLFS